MVSTGHSLSLLVTYALDKLLAIVADDVLGESDLAVTDETVHLLGLLGIERTPAAAHLEQEHAKRPEVDVLAVAFLVEKDLGGEVLGRAAERVGELVVGQVGLGQTKVAKGNVACGVEKDVLGLEVTVHNVVLVEMLKGQHKLSNVEPCTVLGEAALFLEMPEQLSTALVVGDEVELLLGLEGELEADEEGALERALENLALADGVRDFLLGDDFLLGENLHGVDTLRVLLADLEDATKGATTDELEELEIGRL